MTVTLIGEVVTLLLSRRHTLVGKTASSTQTKPHGVVLNEEL